MEKFSVKKPFTILVMVIMVLVLGGVSLSKMTTDLLPDMSIPYLIVITTYPGASPEKVESQVSEPIEGSLGTVSGVKNVYSVSNENYSMVQLEFEDGTDMDSAMVKVSSAMDIASASLPEECGTPSIMEISMDMMATQYLAVSYDGKTTSELSDFVKNTVTPQLERQKGVASVSETGMVEESIQVDLNKNKVDELNDKILAKANDGFADALESLDEAKEKLIDGQQELDDSVDELNEQQDKLDSAKQELEDGKNQLDSQKTQTYETLAQASAALDQLSAYQTQLLSQQANQTVLKQAIDTIKSQLEEQGITEENLPTAISTMSSAKAGIDSMNVSLSTQADDVPLTEMEQASLAALSAQLSASGQDVSAFESIGDSRPTAKAVLSGISDGLQSGIDGLNTASTKLTQYETTLSGLEVEIQVTEGIISKYEEQLASSGVDYTQIEAAKMQAAAGFGSADAQMTSGEQSLESAQSQMDSGKDSIESGQEQIDSGWEEYNNSLDTFTTQRNEALKKANADALISLDTLSQLVYAENFAMPAGYIDDANDNSWLLKVGDNFTSVEELNNFMLTHIDDVGDVRLSDVADVTVIDNSADNYARMNGENAVILSVFKNSTSGTNEVSHRCNQAVSAMTAKYDGLSVVTLTDQGDYITLIVNSVLKSMILGAILAIIILALFLKDVKPTLVVAVSIPLSVLAALILMYFTGITLNMMTLSGLALGIGMLVDNSIVVIENIYRLRGRGIQAARAAVQGTRQVAGAIIASTLTTVCVFLPMIFTTGTVRELIMPMSLTIIFCLLASLFISMTVVPATGSTILKNAKAKEHPWFDKVQERYGRILDKCLSRKIIPLGIAVLLLAFSIWQVIRMGVVMIPDMTSTQLEASITIPDDVDKTTAYETTDEVLSRIGQIKGVGTVGAMAGGEESLVSSMAAENPDNYKKYTVMIMMEDENAGENEIKSVCRQIADDTKDLNCTVEVSTGMSEMSTMMSSGLSINIYGEDLEELNRISEDVMKLVDSVKGFEDVSNGQEDADQVAHLVINRDIAMQQGLTVAQIYSDLSTKLTEDKTAATITVDGKDMDIVIKDQMDPLTKENLMDFEFDIAKKDDDGNDITETHKLSEFASLETEEGINSISRENQARYITVTAAAQEGYNTTLLSRKLKPLIDKYELPDGYTIDMGGEADSTNQMVIQMGEVLLLGLLFIYLVMVAQFQSLLSPFIVLFTVPLAFTGGLLGLLLAKEPLSVMSLMGFVILLGTVVNNGIVFVDYANQLRMGGMNRRAALIATGKTRMRPILMTALTTILAMTSLIFGDDMGSQLSKGMAIVVAGGLAYATLMTLFIIPVMYDIFFKKQPLAVDIGSENLDDIPDDAKEFMRLEAEKNKKKEMTEPQIEAIEKEEE